MAAPDDGTRGFLPKSKILDFFIFVHKSALSTGFSFNSKYSSSLQTVLILTRLQKLPKRLKLNESRISTNSSSSSSCCQTLETGAIANQVLTGENCSFSCCHVIVIVIAVVNILLLFC